MGIGHKTKLVSLALIVRGFHSSGLIIQNWWLCLNREAKIRHRRSVATNWREHTDTSLIVVREVRLTSMMIPVVKVTRCCCYLRLQIRVGRARLRRSRVAKTWLNNFGLSMMKYLVLGCGGLKRSDGILGADDRESLSTVDRGSLIWTTNQRISMGQCSSKILRNL